MTKLTNPTFEGTGDDEVELIDAYEPVDTEVKNALVSKVYNFKDNIKGNLDKALGQGEKFKDTLDGANEKLKKGLDYLKKVNEVKERVESALKGDRVALNAVMDDIKNSFLGNIKGVGPALSFVNKASESIDKLMIIKGGVTSVLNGDVNSLGKAMGLLEVMSGSKVGEFVDLGVYTSFASEIIGELQHIEETANYLETVFKGVKDEFGNIKYLLDETVRFEIGRTVSGKIDPSVNLRFLDELIGHVGSESLSVDRPSFFKDLLKNYKKPENIEISSNSKWDYKDEIDTLVNVMDGLKDDWFNVEWNKNKVYNYHSISELSEDMEELLLHSDIHRDAVLTAKFYKEESFKDSVKNIYPFYPI